MKVGSSPLSSWDALLVGSLVVITAAVIFTFAVPSPSRASVGSKLRATKQADASARKLQADLPVSQKQLQDRTWDLSAEALGARVLADLTKMAERRHLEVSRFMVAKPVEIAGLLEAKVIVTLEGNFQDLTETIAQLQKPETKILVADMKFATAEGLDRVSCVLTLAGFIRTEKA